MRKIILLFFTLLNAVSAQMAPQPTPEIEHLEGQNYLFCWEGMPGRVYFIQTSSQPPSAAGFAWDFAPDIRIGNGDQIEMGFAATAGNAEFFRLIYTDYSGTEDPDLADFDNDGYTNLEEAIENTDPFDDQAYPGSGTVGDNGGGDGNGGDDNETEWNHAWSYTLTYKIDDAVVRTDTISPFKALGSYSYSLEEDVKTELIFAEGAGGNEATFLQLEPNLDHDENDPNSKEWKFVGVVQLSVQNPNWSYTGADDGGSLPSGVLQPLDITAAFGEGPNQLPPVGPRKFSKEIVTDYLDSIKIGKQGNVWAVEGLDSEGGDRIWGVEVVEDQESLNKAFRSSGRYVIFDGHSNFGLGPDFGGINITKISDLTNYGVKYTDVPLNFRLRGPANDPSNWGSPFIHMSVGDNEIPAAPKNYKPLPIDEQRFPNIDGVGAEQAFSKKGQGFETWHYRIAGGSKRLMIDAPKTDLPAHLSYKTFFYNSCSSGIDYI